MTFYRFTAKSKNSKTGPIPVTTTSSDTCPAACLLKDSGACYAKNGPLATRWAETDKGLYSGSLMQLASSVAALPEGTLWRHNQAGDLPGEGDAIDGAALDTLVAANSGKRGFTYTHKPMTAENAAAVQFANAAGFTINLSANNLAHADELMALQVAPVVTLLPASVQGNVKMQTAQGHTVVVCPATYRDDVNCKSCGLCQVRDRKVIVGFPAHGARKAKASAIAA